MQALAQHSLDNQRKKNPDSRRLMASLPVTSLDIQRYMELLLTPQEQAGCDRATD